MLYTYLLFPVPARARSQNVYPSLSSIRRLWLQNSLKSGLRAAWRCLFLSQLRMYAKPLNSYCTILGSLILCLLSLSFRLAPSL